MLHQQRAFKSSTLQKSSTLASKIKTKILQDSAASQPDSAISQMDSSAATNSQLDSDVTVSQLDSDVTVSRLLESGPSRQESKVAKICSQNVLEILSLCISKVCHKVLRFCKLLDL
jgi:hypothetical protein